MIRITKCKTVGDPGPMPTVERDIFVYRVLDDDKILCTQAIDSNAGVMGEMAIKRTLGSFVLREIEVEEITELEDKELVEKNKLDKIKKDFE